ncbi:MAG: glycerophosphodiester phosphodiesterase family protein [Cellulomonas sp.]
MRIRPPGALEVSLARTSDGVWFGLHDDTLDRTSQVTGKNASSMTWAQVARLQIAGSTATDDPTQPGRPYMRWEELIGAFYPSHVLFVDPKSAFGHIEELMAMMNALPAPQDHLVCKYCGVSGDRLDTTGWARLAAGSGYHRRGYLYGADVPDLAQYQDRWDLLGMNLGADDAAWGAVASYAKPVIGHIEATPRDIATARARGARGVVVSSVRAIPQVELTAQPRT